jgi:hypothetical protein
MDGFEQYDDIEFPLRVFFSTDKKVVDLNCCFLAEKSRRYYCRRDLDGEELVSCEDCQGYTVFMNRRRKIPALA